jgi:hypothetical protein
VGTSSGVASLNSEEHAGDDAAEGQRAADTCGDADGYEF